MPLPSRKVITELKKQSDAKERITQAFKEYGWRRKIQFRWISWSPSIQMPILSVYSVQSKDVPCSCSAKSEATMVQLSSSGVVTTCMNCLRTSGMLDKSLFKIEDEKIISLAEAQRIANETGQRLPPIIQDLLDKKQGVFQIW